jgi:hypothetical protein
MRMNSFYILQHQNPYPMYSGLLLTHSALRYLVLIFLIIAVFTSLAGWIGKKMYTTSDNRISLFAMIACHIQLLMGIVVYFTGNRQTGFSDMSFTMNTPELRFYTIEHPLMMFIAIMLITIGRSTSKKMSTDVGKFRRTAVFYGLGLLIILAMIPWPFLKVFGSWL